jgi:hypothetical protein
LWLKPCLVVYDIKELSFGLGQEKNGVPLYTYVPERRKMASFRDVSLGAYKIEQVKLNPKLVGPLLEHAEPETWIQCGGCSILGLPTKSK